MTEERTVATAREECARTVAQAGEEFNRIRNQALEECERIVKQAAEECERIVKQALEEYNRNKTPQGLEPGEGSTVSPAGLGAEGKERHGLDSEIMGMP